MLISVGLAVVVAVISVSAGHPLVGVCAAAGLGLGALNTRMLQRAVIARANSSITKKRFTGGVFTRLGLVTVLAIGLALLVRPDGLAVFFGLAVFQVLMLVGAAVPVLSKLRWSL